MFTDESALGILSNSPTLPYTVVAFNANGNTLLYTVPTGKTLLLFAVGVQAGANANSTDLSVGGNSASYNDFVSAYQADNLDASADVIWLMPVPSSTPAKCKAYAANTGIYMNVANQAGGATNYVFLLGILY